MNWEKRVLEGVRQMERLGIPEFTVDEFCAHLRTEFERAYPGRKDIRAAVMRRLSVLTSAGLLERVRRGVYRTRHPEA